MVVNCRETVHNRPKDVISGGKINHEFEIFYILKILLIAKILENFRSQPLLLWHAGENEILYLYLEVENFILSR